MSDFLERLKAEQKELSDKVQKLNAFIQSEKFKDVAKEQQHWLVQQYYHMRSYNFILCQRIDNIENPDVPVAKTKGQEIIGSFGVEDLAVGLIKKASISLIDLIEELGSNPTSSDPSRKATSYTDIENAQMMAVKSLF